MATVTLFSAFDFGTAQDWDWNVTNATATSITIQDATHKQTFTGSFTYSATGVVSGTATSASYFLNNAEVLRVTGMSHDAATLAVFAETEGDTQQTYAFVLSGNDTITGSAGNDGLRGYGGNDTISAGAGNDIIMGGAGNDTIDGQAGLDSAVYLGNRAGYTVTRTGAGVTVTDLSGVEGSDTLSGVERILFAGQGIALDVDANGNAGKVYRLYEAAFNRTPDAGGVGYWISVMDKGASLVSIAEGFISSKEYKDAYGSNPSNRDLITKYYQNILDRAPEQAGLNYWVGVLDSKSAPLAQVLAFISESQENIDATIRVIGNGFDYTPWA